mmetsp:Transcript_2472/g.5368  ORF Transcript_2472/g.5368 Transcript_2472/m.5368 type:complete len:416 (+) Transcript_2472:129-1376(+)
MAVSSSGTVFAGVTVCLPSKVRGSEAEEEWQEVDWVAWSSGELTVEGSSYLLIFKPNDGGKTLKAKPLGALIKASGIWPVEESLTFVVSTSDSMHRTYRFAFESDSDIKKFQSLADAAEAAHKEACQASKNSNGAGNDEGSARLEAAVKEAFPSRWPLVFGGAELFGPDPAGDAGSEVLLGHGVAVLLDPPVEEASGRVGSYELIFYGEDEGVRKAVARFPIGPKMALQQQKLDVQDDDGPAVAFDLKPSRTERARTITFEDATVAALFRRDFSVRQRVMELASMTHKRQQQADAARGELEDLRQRSFFMSMIRIVRNIFVFILLVVGVRIAMHYQNNKALTPALCAEVLLKDVQTAIDVSRRTLVNTGSMACELALGAAPAEKVQLCMSLLEGASVDYESSGPVAYRCLKQLVP